MNNNELQHWGIKGQKWGVRRFQNKDGSLTSAGRKRQKMSDDAREANAIKKKKVSEMSNAELRKLNERKNLERNYKQLNPNAIKQGMTIVAATAGAMGTIVGIQKNGKKLLVIGKSITEKVLKK